MTQFGYRIGGFLAGAGSLYLTLFFAWEKVFLIIALMMFFFNDFDYIYYSFEK